MTYSYVAWPNSQMILSRVVTLSSLERSSRKARMACILPSLKLSFLTSLSHWLGTSDCSILHWWDWWDAMVLVSAWLASASFFLFGSEL